MNITLMIKPLLRKIIVNKENNYLPILDANQTVPVIVKQYLCKSPEMISYIRRNHSVQS